MEQEYILNRPSCRTCQCFSAKIQNENCAISRTENWECVSTSADATNKDVFRCKKYRTLRKFLLFVLNYFLRRSRLICKNSKPIQCFLLYFLMGTVIALPKLCSEPAPIDLLAHAISGSDSLPTGVEVASDANNIKGYRFDLSARLLGVDSEEIFPFCNRFPAEYSFILTFQHHVRRKTNEFIMTLLAQDRNTVLLALRLQRNRLFFDYSPNSADSKISSSIKSSAIYDGKWHTVVVTVTSNYVTFTLDCELPKKRKMKRGFHKKLNIRKTKIYIGSRRQKSKRFTGLLRQLILLPGADAAKKVCPSNNPSLATLDNQRSATSLKPTLDIIFENELDTQTCSIQSKGTLKYTHENTFEICTGEHFKPVKGGSDRMDYLVDFEDVITDNLTISIEKFTIPGEGLFIATANNDDNSHIFKWDGKKFARYQDLKTHSAMMWKFFQVDFSYFLVVANSGENGNKNVSSVIYRWSPQRKRFLSHQRLMTCGVRSIEFFSIYDSSFLFVANHQELGEQTDTEGPSIIYRWNSDRCEFQFFQWIKTQAALDVTFFQISLNPKLVFSCFVIANSFNGETSKILSDIYCWNFSESLFEKKQSIETVGAADWEFFQFQNRYFLAVANSFGNVSEGKPQRILNSTIYELNVQFAIFISYQKIETYGANDWEFFQIGKQYFLVVSNTASSTSEIYRWQGIEKFVKVHSLPVGPSSDFDYIQIDGEHYLAQANPIGILSKMYKIITY